MKNIIVLLLLAVFAFGFTADNKVITVKGSDTMVILAQRWAEKYMNLIRALLYKLQAAVQVLVLLH